MMGNIRSLKDGKAEYLKLAVISVLNVSVALVFIFYLDEITVSWLRTLRSGGSPFFSWYESVRPLILFMSNGAPLLAGMTLLYVYGLFLHQRIAEVSKVLILGFLSAGIGVQVMKHLVGRARPRLTDTTLFIGPSLKSGFDSFPSGHAAVAFCLAVILSGRFPRYRYLFYGFGLITAFDRVEGLSHFPSDVLAGAFFGILVAKVFFVKQVVHTREVPVCQR